MSINVSKNYPLRAINYVDVYTAPSYNGLEYKLLIKGLNKGQIGYVGLHLFFFYWHGASNNCFLLWPAYGVEKLNSRLSIKNDVLFNLEFGHKPIQGLYKATIIDKLLDVLSELDDIFILNAEESIEVTSMHPEGLLSYLMANMLLEKELLERYKICGLT